MTQVVHIFESRITHIKAKCIPYIEQGCEVLVECIPSPLRKLSPCSPNFVRNQRKPCRFYKRIVPLGADPIFLFSFQNRAAVSRITFGFHRFRPMSLNNISVVVELRPLRALEDKNMQKENRNEEAVSPVIATILMVAITVVLAGVLYVWASQLAEGNTDGDFSMYGFAVTDAAGSPTNAGGEEIVYIAMDAGDDLSWATVIVQLSDGGSYTECTNPDQAADTGCAVSDNGDGKWAFGEEVTISEGSDDICDGACSVQVKVLDRASNKLIYESTVTSVA